MDITKTRNFETSRIWVTDKDIIISVMWNNADAMEEFYQDIKKIVDDGFGFSNVDLCHFFKVLTIPHKCVFGYVWEIIGTCYGYDENFFVRFE